MPKIKAVAVIFDDGFLAQSAPTYKPRSRPVMILLSYDQRMSITASDRLITYDDLHYQGKFPGALPTTYLDPESRKVSYGWTNADNQWINADLLHRFLHPRKQPRDEAENLRMVESMIYDLILAAASQ